MQVFIGIIYILYNKFSNLYKLIFNINKMELQLPFYDQFIPHDIQCSDSDTFDSPILQVDDDIVLEDIRSNFLIKYTPPLIEQKLLNTFKRRPQNLFDRILNKE